MVELETLSSATFTPDRPVRPPTPPRESSTDGGRNAFDRVFGSARRLFGRTSSNILVPTITPDSSAASQETTTGSIRKKVEWGEVTDFNVQNLSVPGNQIFSQPEPIRSLPPSAERKPRKSILKVNTYNVSADASGILNRSDTTISYATTFAIMLESTTQQLAGTDRSAKVDAYLTLSESLKAADNVPDLRELRNKMELLLSFIKRDLTEKTDENRPESSLVINALVLLGSFFHSTSVAELIPSEFAVYLVEHCVKTFEDPQASKDVARHLMFIMAKQTFPSKVMNQERVGKLVKALHNIESGNLTGKRIVDGRINIYRTLIRQSRTYMLSNHLWLQDLFTDMTSNLKEIRTHAITLGLEAGFSYGMEVKMTRAIQLFFETELEDKGKYGQIFIARLKQMLQKKDEKDTTSAAAVPQIWSVVILFFQGRIRLLMQWEFLSDWLKLISDTFNQSDVPARKEALVAWNKFIFVIYSNEQNSASSGTANFLKMLPQALERQLRRENLRVQSLNTLCCLLHYSFKSATTPTQQDSCWNQHIVPLVGNGLIPADVSSNPKKARAALTDACSVLQGLFDHTTKRTYNENRILDNNFSVNELQPVDPKWLRKSALIVFPLMSSLMEKMFWELGEPSEINQLWRTYIKSIASPAVKEITVSMDTMTSVACIFGFLHKVWNAGPKGLNSLPRPASNISDSSAFLKSFEHVVTTLLNGIGPLPFTDRQLSIGNSDIFLPVATPSQRPAKLRGQVKSPFHHLLTLLATPSPNLEYDQSFARVVQRILSPFYECRKTKRNQIELSKTLLELLPAENTEPCRIIWQVIANFTTSVVDTRDTENSAPRDQPLGARYKDLVKVLEFGIGLSQQEAIPGWKALFDATVCSATLDAGDAGKAIAVIEPLCATLLRKNTPTSPLVKLLHFNLIVGKASYPKDKQALDVAGKRLWGAVPNGQRGVSFDPFAHLYELCQASLETSYTSFEAPKLHNYVDMLTGTVALMTRCPLVLYYGLLISIHSGISIWVQNSNSKFSGGDKLSTPVMSMMNKTWDILSQLQNTIDHSRLLSEFETLLCSSLESKQKDAVNTTIKFWNASFGTSEQELQYPDRLKEILLKLRAITEIELPSLPASLVSEAAVDARQPMDFEDSQFDAGSMFIGSGLSSVLRLRNTSNQLLSSPSRRLKEASPQVLLSSTSLKRTRGDTSELKGRKSRKRQSTPKLRHDDSQVQFQPIDSSPIADRVADSQMLTDRQKEVKERQQLDAGMFQNIGSSPLKSKSFEADPELPVHRSSSLLRSVSRERHPTPTLVTPSDDDGFVASSPTPTRSLRGEVGEDGPPSSPPEPSRDVVMNFNDDVPSSSSDADEPEADMSTSFGQFAQSRSAAEEVKSTYGSPVDFNGVLTSGQTTSSEEVNGQSETEDHEVEIPTPKPSRILEINEAIEETILESPSTPKRRKPVTVSSIPKTPREAFVDARGSPISSDKIEGEDDVFEDAVSSPRLHVERAPAKIVSSSPSDLDESSMLRVLEEAENQAKTTAQEVSDKEKGTSRTRKSTRSLSAQPKQRKAYQLRKEEIGNSSSSFPSHIPETPAPIALPISAKIMIDNQALSPEETIFVDDSELYEEVDTPRSGKRLKQKIFVAHSRKRKSTEDLEVGDSLEDIGRGSSLSSQTSSVKRGRGRPRKIPRPSPSQEGSSVGLRRSQSMLSFASVNEEEEKPSTAALERDEMEIEGTDQFITAEAEHDIEGAVESSVDLVPETTVDDGSFANNPNLKSEEDDEMQEQEIASTPTPTPSNLLSPNHDRGNETEEEVSQQIIEETRIMSQSHTPVPPVLTAMEAVREQIRVLMGTLETAALSRKEVGELEDLLMDTKELLYGAARRGRGRRG